MIDFLVNAGFFVCGFVVSWLFLLSREWIFIPFSIEDASEEEVLEQVEYFAYWCDVEVKAKDMRIRNDWTDY